MFPQQKNYQELSGEREILQFLFGIRMTVRNMKFDKGHIGFRLIIVKGLQDVRIGIGHFQLFGSPGKERSLKSQRQQNDHKDQVEDIIL